MSLYKNLLKFPLFALEPETAHRTAMKALKTLGALPGGINALRKAFVGEYQGSSTRLWNLEFPNPVGLAAGFDKQAEAPHLWEHLGFGFFEIGTVTAQAQAGNPHPRIFRLSEDQALINRLGFNNPGAEAVAASLAKRFRKRRPAIPMGINIGKSKTTPLEQATEDYLFSFERLYPFADFFVVNVSSPNTPGLRDLQEKESLRKLLGSLMKRGRELASAAAAEKPLLVKLAPDFSNEAFIEAIDVLLQSGVAGVVLVNTTLERQGLQSAQKGEEGGLSGKPLRKRALELIRLTFEHAGERLPIIGCGGIFNTADALETLRAGARLIEVYTGLIYEGPGLPGKICSKLMKTDVI